MNVWVLGIVVADVGGRGRGLNEVEGLKKGEKVKEVRVDDGIPQL